MTVGGPGDGDGDGDGGSEPADFLALNDLFEQLALRDPVAGEIVKLRILAGLTIPEIAQIKNLAPRNVG